MTATKTFSYEALDAAGARVKGTIDSDSKDAAASSLVAQKLVPLSVTGSGEGLQKDLKIPGFSKRTSLKDLAIFARQFASMTTSGLTLLRTLTILEEQTGRPKLRAAVTQVRSDVQDGATLSKAMSRHPDEFPLLMVNMIKAGEAGGFLDEALARIAKMYEADATLRAKIKSAMTYPVIVLIFSLLMGTGVILFIVPIFEKMFKQLGGKLPMPTQVMVTLSHNMWWGLPLGLVVTIGGMRLYRVRRRDSFAFRLTTDKLKLRLPVFGNLFTKLAISPVGTQPGHPARGRRADHPGIGDRRRHCRQCDCRGSDGRRARRSSGWLAHVAAARQASAVPVDGGADARGRRRDGTDLRDARQSR